MINFGQHLHRDDPSCLLVWVKVNQQVELFSLQWVKCSEGRGQTSKWDQSRLGVPGYILLTGIHSWKWGIYQEDMNEAALAATKTMCKKVNQFLEEGVWIKCLFIEVIRVSLHCRASSFSLRSGTPRHQGRGRYSATSIHTSHSYPSARLDRRLLSGSAKLHQVSLN